MLCGGGERGGSLDSSLLTLPGAWPTPYEAGQWPSTCQAVQRDKRAPSVPGPEWSCHLGGFQPAPAAGSQPLCPVSRGSWAERGPRPQRKSVQWSIQAPECPQPLKRQAVPMSLSLPHPRQIPKGPGALTAWHLSPTDLLTARQAVALLCLQGPERARTGTHAHALSAGRLSTQRIQVRADPTAGLPWPCPGLPSPLGSFTPKVQSHPHPPTPPRPAPDRIC